MTAIPLLFIAIVVCTVLAAAVHDLAVFLWKKYTTPKPQPSIMDAPTATTIYRRERNQ